MYGSLKPKGNLDSGYRLQSRPGKHYVYVSQYISFIFDISGSEVTYPFLDLLLRRVGRVVDSVYRLGHVWERGMDMYIKVGLLAKDC